MQLVTFLRLTIFFTVAAWPVMWLVQRRRSRQSDVAE
jgi:hypothetical protein